ncbi:hypothetical protein WA026_006405 [Henosepilachna vigintioctopunctata]|uniref:Low-density lipoprotein receptor-related protein 4 n=1 Tax=Henosepilachna vigintioctopunctata TaxID=420089 RepID=A0AAW1TJD6_9CUCU
MCYPSIRKFVLLICIWCLNTVSTTENMTVNTMKHPRHRGAARQMYGSGSLRPRESRPVYATGQRHYGERTTIGPDTGDYQPLPEIPSYRLLPYSFPYGAASYPVPEVIGGSRSFTRTRSGGKYGGREEYYTGRPVGHGVMRGKYPFDLGHIPGRGFERTPTGFARKPNLIGISDKMKDLIHPADLPDASDEDFEHSCGFSCGIGEYLCVNSCTCIRIESRCDGHYDCKDNEDELDCTELESIRNVKCDEKQNVRCPRTGKCINKEWLCDGDDDCGDFSDETHCGSAKNCSTDQFECANGLCIPRTWVCDDDVDCKDYSDEYNCTQLGCKPEEFDCGDNTCISINWKCDGQIDCTNGKDEVHCNAFVPDCLMEEFLCANNKCIKATFQCDGDNDCEDWSDESDCDSIQQTCVTGEFRCSNGRCIADRFRCDKKQDCENNDDEFNCDYSIRKNCSSDEFTCRNESCISKTWVCDGNQDCNDGEDESDCQIVCDKSKVSCAKSYPLDNSTDYCIHKKHVCDGHEDCPKGEDELNCPTKRDCDRGTNCTQLCITTHDNKPACSCFPGFNLAADGISCEDIDECLYETDPVCSQKCTNTKGSFICGCMTGYVLRPDLRSCKAQGAPSTLLFANRKDIRQVSLNNAKYTAILKGLQNAIALDYHYEKKLIFWSDISIDVIRKAFINGSSPKDVIKVGLEAPGGLAVDWIHNLLFWTDAGTQRVEVATIDGENRAILAADDVDKPKAIVVHPGKTLVFWTDWGPNPKIERAEMDGTNRNSIITESIFWPNGLTLDYTADRIYWADAKHNVIESSLFDGSNRKKVVTKGLPHPFAITIFEDVIYWTDWHTKSISCASKSTGVGLRTIHSKLYFPMDIHSHHSQRQPKYKNHCGKNNGGCAHMCLPNKESYTCVCRLGQKLDSDQKSCAQPEKFVFFARKRNLFIKHLDEDALHQHVVVIPVEGLKSVSGIAWDSVLDIIFWTDVDKKTINKAYWNGSNQEVIINTNLESPVALAYDWLTQKIYWVDAELNRIEVVSINGENRLLLVWDNLDKPRDIVVDPNAGFLYWVTWSEQPRIERVAMDGSLRRIIIKNDLTWPSGMSIDYKTRKLFWVDSGAKSMSMSNLDGTERKIVLEGSTLPHPYGLDVFDDYVYWTDWNNSTLEKADKFNGRNRTVIERKLTNVMQVKIFHRTRKFTQTPCNNKNGGCSHLCLIKPQGYSCACPTGIKLKADGKTCANGPTNYLILAHRSNIRQISLDVPYIADVVLPFPPLKMAASVDVDRKTGDIYWTDTAEDVIKSIKPDGTNMRVILMHDLLMPDGICIDSTGRKIYWTDGVRNSIEVSELDGTNRKVLFSTNIDKPRAITLHYHHGLMFWSEWGKNPKIEVANMDGDNRKILINTNLVWPNGLTIDRPASRLYWNDGKLNKIESSTLNGHDRKLILKNIPHPYGLVIVGSHMYWTDWQTQALHRAGKFRGTDRKEIRGKLEGLMDVRAVQSDNIAENACGSNNGNCSHLCLRNPVSFTCACPTGLLLARNSTNVCQKIPSTFLLVSTRFTISRISLDTPDTWDYTLPIKNINDAVDLDFHWEQKLIYYTDVQHIRSISMNNLSDIRDVVRTSANGISVDWIANNIYWTNNDNKKIEVSRIDGSCRKTLIEENLKDPHSIAVYPRKGYLYWTDWDNAKIERSYLDGSSRLVLIKDDITCPVGLVIDHVSKRLYWIDAKQNEEKIETSNLRGQNRIILDIEHTYPYSLTQFKEFIYWTDWRQKSVYRADKTSGKGKIVLRPNLDAAMGITMVTEARQIGWNPCAVNNGGCKYICFHFNNSYTCECPDSIVDCNKEPSKRVSEKCSKDKSNCGGQYENDDDDESMYDTNFNNNNFNGVIEHPESPHSDSYYIASLLLMVSIISLCIVFVVVFLFMRSKKSYAYGNGRSFANPNYYSPNNETSTSMNPQNNTERKQFIWKRLKYDKSQERVYEETVGTNSPEVVSLIPMLLTPNSSKGDGMTSDIERSPSATPLQDLTDIDPVI